jgi:hypothetical protein
MNMNTKTIKMIMLNVGVMLITPSISIAKEWRGIVPLHSTCEDVKRILGIEKCETSFYQLKDEAVYISFAEYPCHGQWNVPSGTVTGLTVYPRNKPLLADLRLDEKKYKKETEVDVPENVYYVDEEEGFGISVSNGVVTGFSYFATAKDSHFRCPNYPAPSPTEGKRTSRLMLFDKYNGLSFKEEKERLNNFAILLQQEPEALGYIMVYAGRRARVGEAKARGERAKKYLVTKHGIESGRIIITDGGHQEKLTIELWAGARGSSAPSAFPTVNPSEVQIIKSGNNDRQSSRSRCK